MRIHYVVPPKGVKFRSQADAQAAFEAGQVWQCTGFADVDKETGKHKSTRYEAPVPARYTEGDRVKMHDESVVYLPYTWALQWKPGRVSFLRYSVRHGQRKVSYHYGPGQGKALITEVVLSSHEKFKARKVVAKQAEALQTELKREGGWMTSGGLRFRPVFDNERMDLDPFPMVVWHERSREEKMGPVYLDANPACRTLGDRELERWYQSASYRAYNPYARRLEEYRVSGAWNSTAGNFHTRPATESDNELDRCRPESWSPDAFIVRPSYIYGNGTPKGVDS